MAKKKRVITKSVAKRRISLTDYERALISQGLAVWFSDYNDCPPEAQQLERRIREYTPKGKDK